MVDPMERTKATKDTVQELTESAADHIGRIVSIITAAVRDIAREAGDWATEVFELREAATKAKADRAEAEVIDGDVTEVSEVSEVSDVGSGNGAADATSDVAGDGAGTVDGGGDKQP